MPNALLDVEGLNIYGYFMHSCERIVSDVSFSLFEGERLALLGESGSGKSMILNAITSSLPDNCFATGKIYIDGVEILNKTRSAKRILQEKAAYLPQGGAESLNPSLRIKTQMEETLKGSKREKRASCIENLKKVGIDNPEEILDKYPFEISGGEAQRVVLSIALSMNKKLLIIDEATRGIDKEKSGLIWDYLENELGSASILLVTHDVSEAQKCEKVLVLYKGKVEGMGNKDDIFKRSKNPYIEKLIADYEGEYA